MSVTGYNDLEIASALDPSITTVRTPFEPVAQGAVAYLLATLAGKPAPEPHLIRTELVVRASTGAPRRRSLSRRP
jgi:DNA-binding LacI/PurR family transcriptional regulator